MKQRSRTEYSLINMGTNLAGFGITSIVALICRMIFLRLLSAEYLGVSGLFSNILTMLSLAEMGVGSAICYALYKPIAENDTAKIASLMGFYERAYRLIGGVVAIVGMAMMPLLRFIITKRPEIPENLYFIYLLYLLNTVISYFYSYRSTLLTAAQRNYLVVGYSYAVAIIQNLVQIAFLLIVRSFYGYLVIQLLGTLAYNVWISQKAAHDYPCIKYRNVEPLPQTEKKALYRNIKALTVNKISGVLVNNTDNIAITYFSGLKNVGFASNYVLFSSMLDSIITKSFNALTGSVGNLNATKGEEESYRFFKVLNLSNFWLYGWAAIGMAFVSGDLVALFYGKAFLMEPRIPMILAINLFTIGMLHSFYTYKSTLGLFRYGQYILIFTGIFNLLLDVVLGRAFGTFGIYLATLLARLITNIWYEPYAVYRYGFHKSPLIYLLRYLMLVSVLLAAALPCGLLCGICPFTPIANLFLKILICTVLPNGVFLICFRKTDEFRYLKHSVIQIMRRRHDTCG